MQTITFQQSDVLLKCRIAPAHFNGERSLTFEVGGKTWYTYQSAWMCFRAADMTVAADCPEADSYDGLAVIFRVGFTSAGGWVRYWAGHDTNVMSELDEVALREALIPRPSTTL